jgi:hypothetical protein
MVTADLLARARAGDGEAFRELAESHRRELQVHCYRMLGSFADVWRTQVVLHGKSGHGTLAGLPMGRYALRVAIFDKHNKGLTSVTRRLTVYGPVPLSMLCNQPQGSAVIHGGFRGGCGHTQDVTTAIVGSHAFHYFVAVTTYTTSADAIDVTRSTCRSIDLTYGFEADLEGPGQVVSASLLAEQADAVVTSAGAGQLQTFHAKLDGGGGWALSLASLKPARFPSLTVVFINGTMSCYTANGV